MRMPALIALLLACCNGSIAATQPDPADLDALLSQVRENRALSAQENAQREARFLSEKANRQQRLEEARAALATEEARSETLQQAFDANEQRLIELEQRLHERSGSLHELSGIYRQVWGDTRALLENSLVSAQLPGRMTSLDKLALQQGLPSIAQLEELWFAHQQEMTESGKVARFTAPVVKADGSTAQQHVTRVGSFTAVADGRYLRYQPANSRLEELPRQPAARYRELATGLETADGDLVPMAIDPARGAVLDLLMQ
ncbi:MAG: hypothetical protein R3308_06875, partial [Thiohalobacterales bacterium]|nr:hypothetical protein [Thiohalobacterales bacterium]